MALKRSKCDPNGVKVIIFSKNSKNCSATGGFAPRTLTHNTFKLQQFAQRAVRIAIFFEQDHFNFWFKPLSKILVAAERF